MDQVQESPLALALLDRIRSVAAQRGLSVSHLCRLAVNDGKFAQRLEAGCSCSLATYEKFMGWLDRSEAEACQRESGGGNPAGVAA